MDQIIETLRTSLRGGTDSLNPFRSSGESQQRTVLALGFDGAASSAASAGGSRSPVTSASCRPEPLISERLFESGGTARWRFYDRAQAVACACSVAVGVA
jgi:hypothetical protein